LSDDDDDDDVNATDADNTSESGYQMSRYGQHPSGFADHRMPPQWHSSHDNYSTPVEISGTGNCNNLFTLNCT